MRGGELFDVPPGEGAGVLTVTQLTRFVQGRLAELGRVRVEGELSEIARPASGHVYFKLKDSGAVLSCAIWKSQLERALRFAPREGQQVVATGRLDVYAPRGTYSLLVERLEQRGLGALLEALEKLKAELRARGWFERKRALPRMPRRIGVVTSRDTAAWQDFLKTRAARWPGFPLRLCHTPVQGAGAAHEIAKAIAALDASGVDAIALVRGGGSLEDLWAFNELPVAEALWRCSVPVVSGVGHETDVTLADLVADQRAHTPTDAAQRLIPSRADELARVARALGYLGDAIGAELEQRRDRLESLARSRELSSPRWILGERGERLAQLLRRSQLAARARAHAAERALLGAHARLARQDPRARLAPLQQRLAAARARLLALRARPLERARAKLTELERSLAATSPLAVLGRGYSLALVRRADGRHELVRDARQVAAGDTLLTWLGRGGLRSVVERVAPAAERAEEL